MNCKKCQKLLYEYIDEALPPRTRASFEEHVQGCHECRQQLLREQDFSGSTSELLHRRTESLRLRQDSQRGLLDALQSGASPRIRQYGWRPLLRPAVVLVTAACFAIVAAVALRGHKPASPKPSPTAPPLRGPESFLVCTATIYADEAKTDWIERRMIVETRNGREGQLRIVARKNPKPDQTNQKEEEQS